MLEREKAVLKSVARRRWLERGPGILIGWIDSSLVLDAWVPLASVGDAIPSQAAHRVSGSAWAWLRSGPLSDAELRQASIDRIPVVLCLPLPARPHPELDIFWS
jgi:hypothetical protein